MQQEQLFPAKYREYTARQINILNSPKQLGNCDRDSEPYLEELEIDILNKNNQFNLPLMSMKLFIDGRHMFRVFQHFLFNLFLINMFLNIKIQLF